MECKDKIIEMIESQSEDNQRRLLKIIELVILSWNQESSET